MIVQYNDKYEKEWDKFVLEDSINGNFLQTRNFYNYHPKGRFIDGSILFLKGDRIAAVIPANVTDDGNTLIAHQGSTYGGIVIGKEYANIANYKWIFDELMSYITNRNYKKVILRMHNWLYSPVDARNELCEYFFQLKGFYSISEIGFYLDLGTLGNDYTGKFEKLKKRKLNKARKQNLLFRELVSDEEIYTFHNVLTDNMTKFHKIPRHTKEELLDFKKSRLKDVTAFYGVFHDNDMIAGSMVWNFCNKKVFHTQYLASRHDSLDYCPNEYLYSCLIKKAIDDGYRFLSYGTASLEYGMIFNESLAQYKEGFNTDTYMNRSYIWEKEGR